jgi:hypothetical protein
MTDEPDPPSGAESETPADGLDGITLGDGLTGGWTDAQRRAFTVRFAPAIESLRRELAPGLERAREAIAAAMPNMSELSEAIRRMNHTWLNTEMRAAFRDLTAGIVEALPPNRRGHSVQIAAARYCIEAEGLPLVWIPRGEVIVELLAADDFSGREAVLLDRRDTILDACEAAAAAVTSTELTPQREACLEAIAALRAGLARSAQALAATVTDTCVKRVYSQHLKSEYAVRGDLPLRKIRTALAVAASERAYQSFRGKDPVPEAFNRHATVHTVDPKQFTPANALVAVMLATSMTREANELLTAGVITPAAA